MPVTTTAAAGTAGTTAGVSATTTALVVASIAATVASTAIAARAARQQGKTASAIGEFNAQTVEVQAAEEAERLKIAGRVKQERLLEERRRTLARNRAKFGKAGVMLEGSPLLRQQEVAKNITQDAVMTNFNTQIGVTGVLTRAESEAQLSLIRGRSARQAGRLQVGQALFSGATQVAQTGLAVELARTT